MEEYDIIEDISQRFINVNDKMSRYNTTGSGYNSVSIFSDMLINETRELAQKMLENRKQVFNEVKRIVVGNEFVPMELDYISKDLLRYKELYREKKDHCDSYVEQYKQIAGEYRKKPYPEDVREIDRMEAALSREGDWFNILSEAVEMYITVFRYYKLIPEQSPIEQPPLELKKEQRIQKKK
ncbi:hypothetical protein EZS27_028632 [termite gut metagenome]|uniref:Uncharacterized protein n=1 Tax=termite gut metagenome TaxID=433724 RepID=A0A5J4QLE5_9ZZZZ